MTKRKTGLRLVRKGPPIQASKDDIERVRLELELAQERLNQRRALVARLVQDIRTDSTVGAVLRKALIERERDERDCDLLGDTLSRMKGE